MKPRLHSRCGSGLPGKVRRKASLVASFLSVVALVAVSGIGPPQPAAAAEADRPATNAQVTNAPATNGPASDQKVIDQKTSVELKNLAKAVADLQGTVMVGNQKDSDLFKTLKGLETNVLELNRKLSAKGPEPAPRFNLELERQLGPLAAQVGQMNTNVSGLSETVSSHQQVGLWGLTTVLVVLANLGFGVWMFLALRGRIETRAQAGQGVGEEIKRTAGEAVKKAVAEAMKEAAAGALADSRRSLPSTGTPRPGMSSAETRKTADPAPMDPKFLEPVLAQVASLSRTLNALDKGLDHMKTAFKEELGTALDELKQELIARVNTFESALDDLKQEQTARVNTLLEKLALLEQPEPEPPPPPAPEPEPAKPSPPPAPDGAPLDSNWPVAFCQGGALAQWQERIMAGLDEADENARALFDAIFALEDQCRQPQHDLPRLAKALHEVSLQAHRFWKDKPEDFYDTAILWRDAFNALLTSRKLPLEIQAVNPRDRFDTTRMVCAEGSSGSRLVVKEPLSWVIMDKSNSERSKVLFHGVVLTA
jgi:hypothetical protein